MCLGFGTAKSEILEYLGLGDLEKEILFSAAPRAAIQTGLETVSYTHLDVYKRQASRKWLRNAFGGKPP